MAAAGGSAIRRRRLARELKQLRDAAGLTVEAVSDELSIARNTIYRYEAGRSQVRIVYLRLMLDLYGAEPPQRDTLLTIARESKQQGWWAPYVELMPERFQDYVELEAEASSLRAYDTSFVHGLLQTEDYARSVLQPDIDEAKIEHYIEIRLARQEVLARAEKPLRFWAILDEAVLHRQIGGPRVMRAQLDRLLAEAKRPNVTIQVVPYASGAYTGMGWQFAVLEFPDSADPDIAFLEGLLRDSYEEDAENVRRYSIAFDHLRAVALAPDESAKLIARVAGQTSGAERKKGWDSDA